MKKTLWFTHAACIVAGVLIAKSLHPVRQNDDAAMVIPAPAAASVTASSEPLPVPAPTGPASRQPDAPVTNPGSQATTDSLAEAKKYAATFQPGLAHEEPMPLFAVLHVSDRGNRRLFESDQAHQQLYHDAWSAAMAFRLQNFFQAQPEINATRVSVSCRSTQCQVQFMELRVPSAETWRNARALILRVQDEPWFSEELTDGPQLTTKQGFDVHYLLKTWLRRRAAPQ